MLVASSIFKRKGKEGDFLHMIQSGNHENSLFIFNDNEEEHFTYKRGRGNAVIRPYNCYSNSKIYSAGISTGRKCSGGYSVLDEETKKFIDLCVDEIKDLLKNGEYNTIYFSSNTNGFLGTSIFNVNIDVKMYITNEILKLEYIS